MRAVFFLMTLYCGLAASAAPNDGRHILTVALDAQDDYPKALSLTNPNSGEEFDLKGKSALGPWESTPLRAGTYLLMVGPVNLAWVEECYASRFVRMRNSDRSVKIKMSNSRFRLLLDTRSFALPKKAWLGFCLGEPGGKKYYLVNSVVEAGQAACDMELPFVRPGKYLFKIIDTGNRGVELCKKRFEITPADFRRGFIKIECQE